MDKRHYVHDTHREYISVHAFKSKLRLIIYWYAATQAVKSRCTKMYNICRSFRYWSSFFISSGKIFNFLFFPSRISTVKTYEMGGMQCLQKICQPKLSSDRKSNYCRETSNNKNKNRNHDFIDNFSWCVSLESVDISCSWPMGRTHTHREKLSTIPRITSVKEIACRYNLIIVPTTNRVIYTKSLEF